MKIEKKVRIGKVATSSYEPATPDSYVEKRSYFIYNNDKEVFYPIRLKKKDLLKVFREKKDEIEKYTSDYKLGYRKEKDVKRIVMFYNSL